MSHEEEPTTRTTTPPLKHHQSPMLNNISQLTTCVSDESCVKCAFDFDYDDEEIYVIDDDEEEDDDDDYCINNDGAYWKTPGHYHYPFCNTSPFYQQEQRDISSSWDNYDHETLTTRFSRQTSATLESILGANSNTTSSILSTSANFIIEDLHLLEQTNHQSTDSDDDGKKGSTVSKFEGPRSPNNFSPTQPQPSPHHPTLTIQALPLVQAVVKSGHHSPLPLHQNLKSQSPTTTTLTSPNNNDTATTPQQSGNTPQRRRRWSNLSPTFFGSKTPSPKTPQSSPVATARTLPPIVEGRDDDSDAISKKSKNTHPSTSTATMEESLSSLTMSNANSREQPSSSVEVDFHHGYRHTRNIKGLELTLSGSIIMEEEEEGEDQSKRSEIIRLDSIVCNNNNNIISPSSSLLFSLTEDDLVILEKQSKRKRLWNKLKFKVSAWKRIAMFHLFPHRRTYTRFEI